MPDKGMANCFCGAPILLTRNKRNDGVILEHLGDETLTTEIADRVKGRPMWRMMGWLEDIHGLREKGAGTESMCPPGMFGSILDCEGT